MTALYEPADASTAAALLAVAAADGISLLPVGRRTKLRADASSGSVVPLSTSKLTSGLAHYAGDLVATAPSGATLRDVNAVLASERQWIPLDPPYEAQASIGGIVSCNDSGPRRHRFGSPRDLIIGIEVALTNGRVAHSGGRVVKNVAGYDLARLFCGSHGSLGLITAVTFKLAPIAPVSRTLVATFDQIERAIAAALTLAAAPSLTPSALELAAPGPRVLVRFDTTARAAEHMANASRALLEADGGIVDDHEDRDAVWVEHGRRESPDRGLVANLSVLPSRGAAACQQVERLASTHAVDWSLTGRAALGVFRVTGQGAADAQAAFTSNLRTAVHTLGGSLQVHGIDVSAQPVPDLLGSAGGASSVSFAVKQRFDPMGVLPYWWARE